MLGIAFGRPPNDRPERAQPRVRGVPRSTVSPTNVVPLVGQVMFAITASGLRTLQGLARVNGAHASTVMNALLPLGFGGQVSRRATRAQADDLRAWFREIGDVSLREARRLQAELEELGEAVAQGVEPLDPFAPHRRRWRSKS
jgi:hypothetical protein